MTAPRDPGLQRERTELSWRRTLLALAAAALVSVRLLPPVLGDWTVGTGLGGVVVAAVIWALVHRRQRRDPLPGGAAIAVLALFSAAGAALGLAYLLVGLLP